MSRPRVVALVGPRGAGKTTVARALAARLGWPAADGDERIAASVGEPAGAFLARVGESAFRVVEEALTRGALAGPAPQVLALGGGAVLSAAVRAALREPGVFVVFLHAPVATLTGRIAADPLRPPLTALPPAEEIEALLRVRRPLYESVADFELETAGLDVDAACARIEAKIRGRA